VNAGGVAGSQRAAWAALALLAGSVVLAQQPNKPNPERQAARQQLRQTMIEWAQTTIWPTLTQWKNQLDAAMDPQDLTTLNGLRARAATLRKEFMAQRNNMRTAWQDEDYDALKNHRDALKGMRQQRHDLLKELKPLAIKYRETLQQIGETAKPQVTQWRETARQKVEEWLAANTDGFGRRPFGFYGAPWQGWGKMFGVDGQMQKKRAAARFMLWNGEAMTEQPETIAPTTPTDDGFRLE
jgi:hypothetical protein